MRQQDQKNLFENLRKGGLSINTDQMGKIVERIDTITNYKPKVGLFGKTGVGKSSIANALFGQELCEISDISSCTRKPQEVLLSLSGSSGLTLVDVPGVGESAERDDEYSALYNKLLPELDVVLWLLKGDDRAFTSDQIFYENVVLPHLKQGKPFFFVLNQVDKIEPFREWDIEEHKPGIKQAKNIDSKVQEVARYFNVATSKIIPVSANENYNLVQLVDEIVFSLPPEKLVTFAKNINEKLVSNKAKQHIQKSTGSYVLSGTTAGASIGAIVGGPVGAAVGGAIGAAIGWVSSKCFISTATMLSLNKNDDCEELMILRKFRDNWLVNQSYGKNLINKYYEDAPKIVDKIDELPNSIQCYNEIWQKYLSNIITNIKKNEYCKALSRYKEMVVNLKRGM